MYSINLLSESIHTTKKNTDSVLDISKEVGSEVNPEQINYRFMSRKQKAGQYHNITIGNKYFESEEHFEYMRKPPNKSKLQIWG